MKPDKGVQPGSLPFALAIGVATVSMLGLLAGCRTDEGFAAPDPNTEAFYWSLDVNHRGVQLSTASPYDTLTLVAIPRTASGKVWSPPTTGDSVTIGPTIFSSSDPSVTVTDDGVIQGRGYGSARITVSKQIAGITHQAEVRVAVSDDVVPPVLDTIRAVFDSAKRAVSDRFVFWFPETEDASGSGLYGFPLHFQSSDTLVASFFDAWMSFLQLKKPGTTRITTSVLAYGVAKVDTFTLTVGYPLTGAFLAGQRAAPGGATARYLNVETQEIGPGGTIAWENRTGDSLDIIFDDPSVVLAHPSPFQNSGAGNILGVRGDSAATLSQRTRHRRFLKPGSHGFRIQPFGFRGTVVVQPK